MRLRFSLLLALAALLTAPLAVAQSAYINELHYDNDGGDVGEFVEIAVPAGVDVADLTLTLYNGNGGASYDTITGDAFTPGATSNGTTLYTVFPSSIQNGSPDGLALSASGSLVQFLSYEGSFTAVDGPASGVASTDIGVSEPGDTPVGQSLQLTGSGDEYGDFAWSGPAEDTPGQPNTGQTFEAPVVVVDPFINELHYDNDGGDVGEFVEIAVPAGVDVADLTLTLYNGNGGASYDTITGDAFTPGATSNGTTLYTVFPSSIQNGSPDGLALSASGSLVQFLSYEGSFTAVDGPASGVASTDIGVSEPGDTPVGQSLQLTGSGAEYGDFAWSGPADQTPGQPNVGQTFEGAAPSEPAMPAVSFVNRDQLAREGDTLMVPVQIRYFGEDPVDDVTVRVAFVGGASTADDADFASADIALATFPANGNDDDDVQMVSFVFADDGALEGPETAVFRLSLVSGTAQVGRPNALTVTIDDPAQTATVADARAAGPGESVTVEAVVSRSMGAFTYVQDETGGLTIRQTSGAFADAVASGAIAPGTRLRVTGVLSEFASLLQINGGDLESFEVLGTGEAPAPQVVTLAELAANGEAYEGELVTVRAVSFLDMGTFAPATTYVITDPSDESTTVAARVPNAADSAVDGQTIPEVADVTAIVGQFNFDDPAAGYQLLLIGADDVGEPVEGGTIAAARAQGVDAMVTVEGVVTRSMGAFTYLQDDTAGITIRQTSGEFFDAVADGTIAPGTRLRVTGVLSEFASLLQINGGDLESFEVLGTTDVPEPQVVTLAELAANGEDYEAELVTVELVSFLDMGTFAPATTYVVTDPSDESATVAARVPNADDSTVDGTEIFATADVTAIVGQFNFDDPAAGYQLLLIEAGDLTERGGVAVEDGPAPGELALGVANPIRGQATVRYAAGTAGTAEVALFDVLGRRVAVVAEGPADATERTATLDATGLSAGVYVLRLMVDGRAESRTVTVVR